MDDKKISAFLAVVETGSYSKAAQKLDYTQSAVTQIIHSIENELSVKLFNRGYSGATLTENGEALLGLFKDADKTLSALKIEAQLLSKSKQFLRIGTFSSVSKSWLPDVITKFKEEYPNIDIKLKIGNDEIMDWLENGEIDLVMTDTTRKKNFTFIPLIKDELLAVVPKKSEISGESVTLKRLYQEGFIKIPLNEVNAGLAEIDKNFNSKAIQVDATDDMSLLYLIGHGLGCSVIAEMSVADYPHDDIRTLHLEPSLYRTLGIAFPSRHSQTTDLFVEFIKKYKK